MASIPPCGVGVFNCTGYGAPVASPYHGQQGLAVSLAFAIWRGALGEYLGAVVDLGMVDGGDLLVA